MPLLPRLQRTEGWLPVPFATDVAALERELGLPLPDDYRAFLGLNAGFEGFFGKEYLTLYAPAELLEAQKHATAHPGCILIGADEVKHGVFIDMTSPATPKYVLIPKNGYTADAIPQGSTLEALLERVHRGELLKPIAP